MATNASASPPLQLATASRPLAFAAGGGGGALLAGGSGGGVATGRGRGRAQRRVVAARSVANDRDVQGPVSPEEGTWLHPPAGSDVSVDGWVAMRFELMWVAADCDKGV